VRIVLGIEIPLVILGVYLATSLAVSSTASVVLVSIVIVAHV